MELSSEMNLDCLGHNHAVGFGLMGINFFRILQHIFSDYPNNYTIWSDLPIF